MEIILYIIFALFLAEHIFLYLGMIKNKKLPEKITFNENNLPFVSVIVAGRNEESNIESCIKSLLNLDYPVDKHEIFLVNDRSTDSTGSIMKKYSSPSNPNVIYFEVEDKPTKLKGKTNALNQVIKNAKGEFIFTTDADCEVKPTWIKEMLKYYDNDTGVVGSYTIMKPVGLNSGFQSLDWVYLLSIACGSDGLNKQTSCVGNNMSYRKAAYNEVGGYENIKFSVTEDFMLMQTIKSKTHWKMKYPLRNECLNWTLPCSGFMELYRQKKRWTKGGLDARSNAAVAGVLAWISSAGMVLGWLAGIKLFAAYLVFKIIIDFLFTFPAAKEFKVLKVYFYLIPFEIWYAFYVFIAPFVVLFDRKVVWKNQKM
jgi:cellulose synthase/poly-beta-1,6-N-acetylglucosamine synthase-like glycosyltransferase